VAVLELEAVSKHFGGLPAVDDVSLRADDGEILSIVGPNGAGKSTLLKLVIGREDPSTGSVYWDGDDITTLAAHRVRQRGIAMVQQTPRTFHTMTVAENVALGALFGGSEGRRSETEALRSADEALALVGLKGRADHSVDSLNLHQQRLVELARALAGRPRLLLLDEVMAGLNDAELEESIAMIRAVRDESNTTVVWVEHVMQAVMRLAERTVVLDFGKVVTEGAPREVMRDPRVVEAYLGKEFDVA
jgi:ABC-type branched-subunit amino acid transport system ATPase component